LTMLFLVTLFRRRRARLLADSGMGLVALVAASVIAACGAGSGDGPDASGADSWEPASVAPECEGKDLCEPASAPVCTDNGAGSRRCVRDDEGCWVWSAVLLCADDAPCEDGLCGGPWCVPTCEPNQECGDDGCGGSCGSCSAPESCCGDICATCQTDCTGRECGWDGATGTCGFCSEGDVCVNGSCLPEGGADCKQFIHDCDRHCQTWDTDCQGQCKAWLSVHGLIDALAWEGCQLLHCAPCFEGGGDQACLNSCIIGQCYEEYASCFNRNGTETCTDTWNCAEACDTEDQPCMDGCTDVATVEAMSILLQLVSCVESTCPPDTPEPERTACEDQAMLTVCAEQADWCLGPCEPLCPGWATCGPDGCTGLCGVCSEGQHCNGSECI